MINSAATLHEVLASDNYWAGHGGDVPLENYTVPLSEVLDGLKHPEIGRTIGRHLFNMKGGLTIEPLEEGEQVPFPADDSRQVVRLVQDSRFIRPRRVSSDTRKLRPEHAITFDERAKEILQTKLYKGSAANATVLSEHPAFVADIKRETYYLRRANRGDFFAGLMASLLDEEGEVVLPATVPVPVTTVGAVYGNRHPGMHYRIVAADILEPTGMAWQTPRGDKPRKKDRSRIRRWIPALTPGQA